MEACKVTFYANMDEADIGAMNELFAKLMSEEMHIETYNLEIKSV